MNMVFELQKQGSDETLEGEAGRFLALEDGSSGMGLARAVVLGVICWGVTFAALWVWIG
jgi:hypothetical protein